MNKIKKVNTLGSENIELRVLENGNIEVIGKIPYNSESEILFNKERRSFFKEVVAPMAFSQCIEQQKEAPALIFNHDMKQKNSVMSFNYKDTKEYFKFIYVIEPSEYLLENINKIGSFSFGFLSKFDQWEKMQNERYDFKRTIHSFDMVTEFSLLVDRVPAYSSARIYFSEEELNKAEVEVFASDIKAFIAMKKQQELKELKEFITKKRK